MSERQAQSLVQPAYLQERSRTVFAWKWTIGGYGDEDNINYQLEYRGNGKKSSNQRHSNKD